MSRARWIVCGAATLAVVWLGPLPGLAREYFSAHMTMHMGVVAVAAPLLALGMAAGPRQPRAAGAAAAVIASVVELIVVWGWHTPALHHAARTSTMALAVEQAMFLTSAFYVWYFALRGGRHASNSAAAGVVALLLTSMHITLLGALLGLAPRPLYPHLSGAAGALDDQHLGGAIMLLVGGLVYLAGGVALTARLVREPQARETRA
jgi:putative membrane protein